MRDYWKLVWSIIGAVVLFVQTALADDNGYTQPEIVATIALALNAFGVWIIPDTAFFKQAKNVVVVLLAGLAVLEFVIIGGITGNEWMSIFIAMLTAVGVIADGRRPIHTIQPASTHGR